MFSQAIRTSSSRLRASPSHFRALATQSKALNDALIATGREHISNGM